MAIKINQPRYALHFLGVAILGLFALSFSMQNTAKNIAGYSSDVIGVTETMLNAQYWQNKLSQANKVILTPEQISVQNQQLFAQNKNMQLVSQYPNSLTKKAIYSKIKAISKVTDAKRFNSQGRLLTDKDWKKYLQSLNLNSLRQTNQLSFGIIIKRTNMRTFPTSDKVYKTANNINIDRFQETALFPTQLVALLHESKDKKWYFAVSYNYAAWVKKDAVALGDKDQLVSYKNTTDFLLVTGSKIFTSYNPYQPQVSQIQLEMGVRLPLVPANEVPTNVGGQNTFASFVVSFPTRNRQGKVKFEYALIPRNADVHRGFLPFTKKNLIAQAFKFLGERYGWGHSFNGRDCTGFVGEIYKSFGILMTRNTGQQAKSQLGQNITFNKKTNTKKRRQVILSLEVGDLIYIPGHVMMVLGFDQEKPYIIHDVSGFAYFNKQGEYYKSILNGVSVTPFLPLQLSKKNSYLDRVYNIKKIK